MAVSQLAWPSGHTSRRPTLQGALDARNECRAPEHEAAVRRSANLVEIGGRELIAEQLAVPGRTLVLACTQRFILVMRDEKERGRPPRICQVA